MELREIEPDPTDATNIVLPTATPPVVEPLEAEDRKDVFDIGTMETKLEEYEREAPAMVTLHSEWLTAYATWSSRFDRAYGKAEFLDQKLLVLLNKEPGEDFEEFEVVNVGLYISSGMVVGSGIVGLVRTIRAWRALAVDATRWTRFKAGGAIALSAVSLIAGAVIAIVNTAERVKFLKRAVVDYADWFTDTTNQINEMKAAVEDEILPRLRNAATTIGINESDDNEMYRKLIAALNGAMTDAAELEAQQRVATRMICGGSFSNSDIANATGLPETVVATRRTEVANNPALCDPYN